MGELEEIKKSIIKKYFDKLAFFEIGFYMEDMENFVANSVPWDNDDYIEFLDMAVKVGAKIVYWCESYFDDKDDKDMPKKVKKVDLGFIHDGILHTMTMYAD